MLLRRWRVILLCSASVMLAVSLLTLVWPKRFDSSALLLVEQRTAAAETPALAVLERLGQASRLETELEILKSRPVVEQVVDLLDLQVSVMGGGDAARPADSFATFDAGPLAQPGTYVIKSIGDGGYEVWSKGSDRLLTAGPSILDMQFSGMRASLADSVPRTITLKVESFSRAAEDVRQRLRVSRPQRDAALIAVTGSGGTPEDAHILCSAVLRSFMRLRTELQRTEATATAEFLRDQVERVGAQLKDAEDRLEGFSRNHSIVALDERASEEVRQHTRLREQRDQLEAERSALASILERNDADGRGHKTYRDLASFHTFLGNLAIAELLGSLVELENRRSELALTRTAQNRDLVALDKRIADIEDQLRAVVVSYEASLAAQIRSLDRTISQSVESMATIPTQQVETARLERETALLGDLFRLLETRLREAEVAQAVNLPGVRVVGEASLPFEPASPCLPRNLALGLALGLLYGLVAAIYREFRDTSLRVRQEVESQTGLPVLTTIPRLRAAGPLLPVTTGANRPEEIDQLFITQGGETAEIAFESFRSIGVALSYAERVFELDRVRSVAIASTARNEGKTFTACNLALARARGNNRTLLIDADLRANGVARFFDLPAKSRGLCDVLAGKAELDDVVQKMWAGDAPFWVLPVGSVAPQSPSMLESEWFQLLLEQATDEFDLVIIDTPPLNILTDGATVASAVNAVFLVVRSGVTEREEVEMTIERLRQADARVVGAILNDVPLPKQHAARYTYYSTPIEENQ